ncbi:hypothetical protein [Salinigranum sp. GCM10025319]|uniref:hypothetical protein n=1 Tax=Salinigranum sp. GCM10025319 TaxID=3252687 RepID=UPI00360DADD3
MSIDRDEIERLNQIVERLREEYADDPNVRTVGWGLASRRGELRDERSIIFYVNEKYPTERAVETAGSRSIPTRIEGYPTDVVEGTPKSTQAGDRDETAYDPLLGGPASSNADEHIWLFNGYGTLGILCRDDDDDTAMALSNWHVWADGGEFGDTIIQPAHPRAGEHLEGLTKVAACGPLVGSLIEGRVPSPLALGLYGGATAAAVAAALSDYRDPVRRGQDATSPRAGERTEREEVDVDVEYPDLPWPGTPFETRVEWEYTRTTDQRTLTHSVSEHRHNAEFLLGQYVSTDSATYEPGDEVDVVGAVWDYQARSCDAYHVVAHLVPDEHPDDAVSVVLHPDTCPRTVPVDPPRDPGQEACVDFGEYRPDQQFPYKYDFRWLSVLDRGQNDLRVVDWLPLGQSDGDGELYLSHDGLRFSHVPATRVTVRVAQFNEPVAVTAYNSAGLQVDQTTGPEEQETVHDIVVEGDAIVATEVTGGGGEGVIVEYCMDPVEDDEIEIEVDEGVIESLRAERTLTHRPPDNSVRAHRCCFRGTTTVPPAEDEGRWSVYLVVQNVNETPHGTDPEEAAGRIGGHVLTAQASIEACTVVMLADHVFDVI